MFFPSVHVFWRKSQRWPPEAIFNFCLEQLEHCLEKKIICRKNAKMALTGSYLLSSQNKHGHLIKISAHTGDDPKLWEVCGHWSHHQTMDDMSQNVWSTSSKRTFILNWMTWLCGDYLLQLWTTLTYKTVEILWPFPQAKPLWHNTYLSCINQDTRCSTKRT